MRYMTDIHEQGIDVIFRDNNRLDEFEWTSDDETLEATLHQSFQAISILTQLWLPEYWMVEIVPFVFGYPNTETESFQVPVDSSSGNLDQAIENITHRIEEHADSERLWSLRSIQTSNKGWSRLALPQDVSVSDAWGVVDPDNILRPYIWRPAPQFAGQKTIWIHVPDANAATHISLVIDGIGAIHIRTFLGISFFNPENDARASNHVVQGAPVSRWQYANMELQQGVIQELEQMGWKHLS